MNIVFRIAKKEFKGFFSSPIAFIFIGVFLAASLFIFFWVERFFATNITEVRPLFKWMPILLIFLTAAVTMRLWAEERRAGTLEFLLTSPVKPSSLVLGKFFACLGLVALSLLLTLPLPLTVSFMGPLDFGPVFGGYLATLFLAAAYIAIGLYVSAKSENQIVSLIVTCLVCAVFYLLGSDTLIAFFGNRGAEILQLLGSGSRFNSITRGVIDLRDLYYYLGIMGVFLSLNVYGLEKIRWADNPSNARHRGWQLVCGLLIANFLAANFWLAPIGALRADMTKGHIYSISEATRSYLGQLKEPLLIRGYFSPQTHPLLAPLVPRIRDLLEEYAVAGGPKVRVEFIDPQEHPELEQEAGQKYAIRPVPFQTASKYQASVTNSYFDLLIQYGDQFETLGFRELIEVKVAGEQELQVELRNPEYEITRAIKKVLYAYQGGGDLFAGIGRPLEFTGYMSADDRLPEELVDLKKGLVGILAEMKSASGGRFSAKIVEPEAENGAVAEKIRNEYGFQPMVASLLGDQQFWFYMTLTQGDRQEEIPLPEELTEKALKQAIEAGLKRFSSGFTKTIALYTPPPAPPTPQLGMNQPPDEPPQFNLLRNILSREHTVTVTELDDGHVPEAAELLLVVAPKALNQKQLFAVDQFLMQGGTVVLATAPFNISLGQGVTAEKQPSGLEAWLQFQGISLGEEMVLDPQNSAFPVPVQRQVGAFTVQETRLIRYPYFVDIRPEGMDQESGLMSGMSQLTMNWSSPITVDAEKNKGRRVIRLAASSKNSWVSPATDIEPNFQQYPDGGFAAGDKPGSQLLAVAIEGRFSSYFAGKPSPLLAAEEKPAKKPGEPEEQKPAEEEKIQIISRQIDKSPDGARIILFASNSFLNDTMLSVDSSVRRTNSLEAVQMMQNAADWSLEDRTLLDIRGRGHFSRSLIPMSRDVQLFWEYVNYGLALLGLILVWLVTRVLAGRAERRHLALLQQSIGRI